MQYLIEIPDLVLEAKQLAEKLDFAVRPEGNQIGAIHSVPSCCIDEVGRLLMTLASTVKDGRIGEIGSGAGVGAAWILSSLQPGSSLVTVESETHLATAVQDLFHRIPAVEVINEDWRESFCQKGPYDLVFADGGEIGAAGVDAWKIFADIIKPGGMAVMDDLTPEEYWPDNWKGKPDLKRELAFNSGFFNATEIRTRERISALLMVKKLNFCIEKQKNAESRCRS